MFQRFRVPLAWRNLIHDKRRFAVSTAGIALAVLLMFVELGFWHALLDASASLIRQFNAELVIVSRAHYTMVVREPFSVRRLAQARGVPGVREAFPVYIEEQLSLWKNPENDKWMEPTSRPIRVIAFNPIHQALRNREIDGQRERLLIPRTVLLDRRSKDDYGKREKNLFRELADQSIEVVGTYAQGTDFTTDGNLVTSDRTFALLFGQSRFSGAVLDLADVGLVQLEPDADPEVVQKALVKALPDDVSVYTLDQFVRNEMNFWQQTTPIGFIFFCGLAMGVIVGMVICSQILSADVADHLKEYATLKAIGYSNRYVMGVVLQEAVLLCLLGFVPALASSYLFYNILGSVTGLPLYLTPGRTGVVLILAAVMCIASGFLALQKVIKADPAEVFS